MSQLPADNPALEIAKAVALTHLHTGNFPQARDQALEYFKTSGRKGPVSIHGPASIRFLEPLFRVNPTALAETSKKAIQAARERIAMASLFCYPIERDRATRFIDNTMMAGARTNSSVKLWLRSGAVLAVKVCNSTDHPCIECASLADKEYSIYDMPEIPHAGCTNRDYGCRCVVVATHTGRL